MDEYWTVQQAADVLHVDKRTIRRWIAAGRLAVLRVARTVRIPRRAVEDLAAGRLPMRRTTDEFTASILDWQRRHRGTPVGTDSGLLGREWRDGGDHL